MRQGEGRQTARLTGGGPQDQTETGDHGRDRHRRKQMITAGQGDGGRDKNLWTLECIETQTHTTPHGAHTVLTHTTRCSHTHALLRPSSFFSSSSVSMSLKLVTCFPVVGSCVSCFTASSFSSLLGLVRFFAQIVRVSTPVVRSADGGCGAAEGTFDDFAVLMVGVDWREDVCGAPAREPSWLPPRPTLKAAAAPRIPCSWVDAHAPTSFSAAHIPHQAAQ